MSPLLQTFANGSALGYRSRGAAAGTAFESIATATVGSGGVASVTFSSIPSTYKHLQIRAIAKYNYTVALDFSNVMLVFNSDTSSSYSYHTLLGRGTSVDVGSASSQSKGVVQTFMPTNAGGDDNNVYGGTVIDILDYADTNKYKTVRGLGGYDRNSSGRISLNSVSWQKTDAITSIQISPDTTDGWVQYSHFALYGIKSA
jgi:hypothetical protein